MKNKDLDNVATFWQVLFALEDVLPGEPDTHEEVLKNLLERVSE